MDVGMITDALKLRARGMDVGDIEKRLGVKKGTMAKLGHSRVLEAGYA